MDCTTKEKNRSVFGQCLLCFWLEPLCFCGHKIVVNTIEMVPKRFKQRPKPNHEQKFAFSYFECHCSGMFHRFRGFHACCFLSLLLVI